MFCMKCGQELPEGAVFCFKCGGHVGTASSTGTTNTETINLNGNHTFVPAMCPNCSAHLRVDSSSKIAHCDFCGVECLVQDAIKSLTVKGNIHVDNAIINVNSTGSETNPDSLLQRVEIMLADGDFSGAMSKCDTILDTDPKNGEVYLFMLMSNLRCRQRCELANQKAPFNNNIYYMKAIQFGDAELKNELQGYLSLVYERLLNERKKEEEKNEAILRNPKVGDKFYFGTNSGKKIWWQVLSVQNRKALIISSSNICSKPFHQPGGKNAWSDCTLRKWLNNDFINGCFTQEEKAKIQPCEIANDRTRNFWMRGAAPTTDHVFLLSIQEANSFFDNDQSRANGSWWWLRSPNENDISSAAYVYDDGKVFIKGGGNVSNNGGVRPAMWIKID